MNVNLGGAGKLLLWGLLAILETTGNMVSSRQRKEQE